MPIVKRVLLALALGAVFGGIVAMELAPSAIMLMVNPSIAPISPSAMCPCLDAAHKVEAALHQAMQWQLAGTALGAIGGLVVSELLLRTLTRYQAKRQTKVDASKSPAPAPTSADPPATA